VRYVTFYPPTYIVQKTEVVASFGVSSLACLLVGLGCEDHVFGIALTGGIGNAEIEAT
jgi:hypothetical protein